MSNKKTAFFVPFALIAIMIGGIVLTACKSTNPQTGQREFDPVKTEQAKAAIQPLIAGAVRRVLAQNPDKAEQIADYLRAGGSVFCNMDLTGQFDPLVLAEKLDALVAPKVKDDYLLDIKNAAIALYRVNYAERNRAELPPEQWARQIAGLFCAAIDQGLKDSGRLGVR